MVDGSISLPDGIVRANVRVSREYGHTLCVCQTLVVTSLTWKDRIEGEKGAHRGSLCKHLFDFPYIQEGLHISGTTSFPPNCIQKLLHLFLLLFGWVFFLAFSDFGSMEFFFIK